MNNCLYSYEVTFFSFCGQDEAVTSRSKTVSVAVVVGKELLQDVMLVVPDPFEQSFVGILSDVGRSGVTVAIQTESNTSTDECFDALFVGGGGQSLSGWTTLGPLRDA